MIWQILLYSYLVTTAISFIIMPIRTYLIGKNEYGKRKSFVVALYIAMICFIPYIGFCATVYVGYLYSKKKMENWINSDPTSPTNKSDPDFVSPPKKKKKAKPIKDRFEILDL
jgi:hypothetical protein